MTASLYQRLFDDDMQDADRLFVAEFADLLAAHHEIERLRAGGADVEFNYRVHDLESSAWLTPAGVAAVVLASGAGPAETIAERWPALRLDLMDGADPASGFVFPSRLVLVCTGAPLPWGTPPEELRPYPAFGLDLLFN